MKRLLHLFPRSFRERYGEELLELGRCLRARDLIDLLLAAAAEHYHQRRRKQMSRKSIATALLVTAALLASASLVSFGYSLSALADGISEVSQHWWSTLPILGLIAATVTLLAGRAVAKGRWVHPRRR